MGITATPLHGKAKGQRRQGLSQKLGPRQGLHRDSHGYVLPQQDSVFLLAGGEIEEGRFHHLCMLLVLGLSEDGSFEKPLAVELGEKARVPKSGQSAGWGQISHSSLHPRKLSLPVGSGPSRAHSKGQASPLDNPPMPSTELSLIMTLPPRDLAGGPHIAEAGALRFPKLCSRIQEKELGTAISKPREQAVGTHPVQGGVGDRPGCEVGTHWVLGVQQREEAQSCEGPE